MKKQLINWITALSRASFVAAILMIADGYCWMGIAFIGAGASLYSVGAIYKGNVTSLTRIGKRSMEYMGSNCHE